MKKSWAIYTDLTGVIDLGGNNGGYPTKEAALERLVEILAGEREAIGVKLANARRALTRERKKQKS